MRRDTIGRKSVGRPSIASRRHGWLRQWVILDLDLRCSRFVVSLDGFYEPDVGFGFRRTGPVKFALASVRAFASSACFLSASPSDKLLNLPVGYGFAIFQAFEQARLDRIRRRWRRQCIDRRRLQNGNGFRFACRPCRRRHVKPRRSSDIPNSAASHGVNWPWGSRSLIALISHRPRYARSVVTQNDTNSLGGVFRLTRNVGVKLGIVEPVSEKPFNITAILNALSSNSSTLVILIIGYNLDPSSL